MSNANRVYLTKIVEAAVLILESHLKVTVPAASGLLAVPLYINQALCNDVNSDPKYGQTCSGAGLYPTFDDGLPQTDVKASYCDSAKINRSHVLDESCLDNKGNPKKNCYKTAAGTIGGVQTDVFIYVNSDVKSCPLDAGRDSGIAAYSLPCLFDPYTHRPTLGMLNICPLALRIFQSSDKLVSAVLHEMLHTLGFISDLFEFFKGDPTKIMTFVPKTSASLRGKTSRCFQEPRWYVRSVSNLTALPLLELQWRIKGEVEVKTVIGRTNCFRGN